MGIEKAKLLAHYSVYWSNINADITKYITCCATCLEFQPKQAKEKTIHHNIPIRLWEVLGTDVFHFNNKNYLCVVDYHSKFPVVKRLEGLSTESPIATIKVIFTEYSIPCRLMPDTGMNFVSDKFQKFSNSINVEQAVLLVYHHQSNRLVKACIKFVKHTFKKMCQFWREHQHDPTTNLYHSVRPGFAEPGNINV